MRGALSLAGALSIPLLAGGHPFPSRDRVVFLVYGIVIGTLVVPSLRLEALVRRLGLAQGEAIQKQEVEARLHVVHAALAKLDEVERDSAGTSAAHDRIRGTLELRLTRLRADKRAHDGDVEGDEETSGPVIARLRLELIGAERRAVAELRDRRETPVQVLSRIQRDIDLDEARLHG